VVTNQGWTAASAAQVCCLSKFNNNAYLIEVQLIGGYAVVTTTIRRPFDGYSTVESLSNRSCNHRFNNYDDEKTKSESDLLPYSWW